MPTQSKKDKKRRWNKYKAFCYFYHPFEDRIHLRKRIIITPAFEPESRDCYVWSDIFKCWLEFPLENVYRIYEILTLYRP